MRNCWQHKSADRPSFANLVKTMETALNKQCPDTALIARYEGEVLPRTNPNSRQKPPPVPPRKPPPNIQAPHKSVKNGSQKQG